MICPTRPHGTAKLPEAAPRSSLQVAMAGASTSVFLMDEVDAALDETNQHLVS